MSVLRFISIYFIYLIILSLPANGQTANSSKFVVISGDTLNLFHFWKDKKYDNGLTGIESKLVVKDSSWNGGDFIISFDKGLKKIVFQEIKNPWTGKDSIIRTIYSEVLDTVLWQVTGLGFDGVRFWFRPIEKGHDYMIPSNPLMLGYADLTENKIYLFKDDEYLPKREQDIYLSYFRIYKGLPLLYFDNWKGEGGDDVVSIDPYWDAPSKLIKVVTYRNNRFEELKVN